MSKELQSQLFEDLYPAWSSAVRDHFPRANGDSFRRAQKDVALLLEIAPGLDAQTVEAGVAVLQELVAIAEQEAEHVPLSEDHQLDQLLRATEEKGRETYGLSASSSPELRREAFRQIKASWFEELFPLWQDNVRAARHTDWGHGMGRAAAEQIDDITHNEQLSPKEKAIARGIVSFYSEVARRVTYGARTAPQRCVTMDEVFRQTEERCRRILTRQAQPEPL